MTVIVPIYNAVHTLERAIASLIAQPFRDWEAVLVDDGSTDGSLALAQRLAAKDGRIRVVHQANGGAGSARNRGIAEAKTEWLLFLDSDDYLDRQAFRRLFAASQDDPDADVVAGRGARVDASGRAWPFPRFDLSEPFSVLSGQCALVIHCAIVRRSRAVEVGGFDATLPTSEDWDFWQKLARSGVRFHQIEPVVAFYHSNPGSLSKGVRQLATNTFEVMRRGHAPDPRVPNPHPAHARGASASNLGYLQLNFILWSAARDIADGGEGVPLLELIDPDVFTTIDAEPNHLGEMIAAGMADVMSVQPAALGARWAEIGPKLRALFAKAYADPSRARQRDMILLTIKNRFGVPIERGDADETPAIVRVGFELGTPLRTVQCAGADTMALQIRRRGRSLGVVFAPLLDDRSGADLADMIMSQFAALPMNAVAPALKPWRSPRFWIAAAKSMSELRGLGLRRILTGGHMPVAAIVKHRVRYAFVDGAEAVVRGLLRCDPKGLVSDSPHRRRIEAMRDALAAAPAAPTAPGTPVAGEHPDQVRSPAAWDAFFESDDPWGYSGPHEQAKYDETMELVPASGVGTALELACAQGHFTTKLARRVGQLLATDISAKALEGAAARCLGQPNVKFKTLDFAREPIPGHFDLIVCSEVLYYLGDAERMRQATRKIAAALNPGGRVIHTHANQIVDEPERSGFDWGHAFGGKTISEAFESIADLELEHEIRTPIYRIQSYRKRVAGAPAIPPIREERALSAPLPLEVARQVIWGGARHSRVMALRSEVTTRVPILMYHRVSNDGHSALDRYRVTPEAFAEQMRFLRSEGFWSVTPDRWAQAMKSNTPLPGRPVMITFDDAYLDFAEHAWPILNAHDLSAVLFAIPGKVGEAADWDSLDGEAAPLLGWHGLRALVAEGASIGGHGFTHRPLSRLGVEAIYDEGLRAGADLQKALGIAPTTFCYPYGASDRVVEQVMAECGYELGFSCSPDVADLSDNPMYLPRIEITGSDDLMTFSRKIGRPIS